MRANAHKWDIWSWYSIVDEVASGGRFKLDGRTPMESAMLAYFYEAMIWYAKERHMSIDFSQV